MWHACGVRWYDLAPLCPAAGSNAHCIQQGTCAVMMIAVMIMPCARNQLKILSDQYVLLGVFSGVVPWCTGAARPEHGPMTASTARAGATLEQHTVWRLRGSGCRDACTVLHLHLHLHLHLQYCSTAVLQYCSTAVAHNGAVLGNESRNAQPAGRCNHRQRMARYGAYRECSSVWLGPCVACPGVKPAAA